MKLSQINREIIKLGLYKYLCSCCRGRREDILPLQTITMKMMIRTVLIMKLKGESEFCLHIYHHCHKKNH